MTTITAVLENTIIAFLITHWRWVLVAYFFVGSFYILFMAYGTLHRLQKAGMLDWFDKFFLSPFVVIGYLEDIVFRMLFGTFLYMDFSFDTLVFTAQCKKWLNDPGWRGLEARWWQKRLNKIDPNHI
jgi:hypothetical protein